MESDPPPAATCEANGHDSGPDGGTFGEATAGGAVGAETAQDKVGFGCPVDSGVA